MSYLSKIRIGVTEEGLNFLKDYVKNKIGEESYKNSYMSDYEVFTKKGDAYFIGWDWIKFYEEMHDVNAIYEALDIMEEKEIPYRMVKVGEDYAEYGAIEVVDADPFNMIPYIYTTIEFIYGEI